LPDFLKQELSTNIYFSESRT